MYSNYVYNYMYGVYNYVNRFKFNSANQFYDIDAFWHTVRYPTVKSDDCY